MSLISLDAGDHSRYLGSASTLGGLPRAGLVGLWTPGGQDGDLNPGAQWYTAGESLILQSEDLTTTWAETGLGTIDDATHFTFAAQNDAVHQSLATISGAEYTLYARARAVSGNTDLHFYHSGLSPASTAQTVTGTLADYATTVTGDGGAVLFGLQDQNASSFGQIEVTKWAVLPGSHTASEAAALYQKTTAQQVLTDWSGSGNDGERGSAAGADSNDYTITSDSRNEAIPGTTEDLTHASWTHTATTDDADNLTFTAQNDLISQDVTTVAGVTYTLSAKIRAVSGNTDLHFYHNNSATGNSTAQAVTATLTRYEVSVLGRAGGGAVSFGIQDQNAAGFGQIEITEWQVEVTGASGPATTYVNPATGRRIVADFAVDDQAVIDNAIASSLGVDKGTVFVVANPDVASSQYLFAHGDTSPRLYFRHLNSDIVCGLASTGNIVLSNDDSATPGQWVILTITYSGGSVTGYVSGVAKLTDSYSGSVTSFDQDFYIGNFPANAYFDGQIALVGVYSRALSQAEITAAYNAIKTWWNYDKRNLLEMNIA